MGSERKTGDVCWAQNKPTVKMDFILSRERSNVRTFEQKDDMF